MGSVIGRAMDENMKKQQDFMLKTQQLTMERQIQMQNQMREKAMAMQLARGRELLNWYASFYALALFGCLAGMRKKGPALIAPMVPLTFILGYQYDLCYYTKMSRIRAEADRIIDTEFSLLELPHGLPNFDTIEKARTSQEGHLKV